MLFIYPARRGACVFPTASLYGFLRPRPDASQGVRVFLTAAFVAKHKQSCFDAVVPIEHRVGRRTRSKTAANDLLAIDAPRLRAA